MGLSVPANGDDPDSLMGPPIHRKVSLVWWLVLRCVISSSWCPNCMSVILTYLPYFFPKCMLSNQIIKKRLQKPLKLLFLDVVVLVVSNSSFPVDFYNDDDEIPVLWYFVCCCQNPASLSLDLLKVSEVRRQLQPSFPCTTRRRCCTLILPRPFQQEIFFFKLLLQQVWLVGI